MQKKKKDMQSGGFTPGPSSRRFEQQTDPNKQPVTIAKYNLLKYLLVNDV